MNAQPRRKPRHDLSYHRRLHGLTPKEEKEVLLNQKLWLEVDEDLDDINGVISMMLIDDDSMEPSDEDTMESSSSDDSTEDICFLFNYKHELEDAWESHALYDETTMACDPRQFILNNMPPKTNRTINDLSDEFILHHLRFTRSNLQLILQLLRRAGLPPTFFSTKNGYKFDSEEAFLLSLFHLCEGEPFVKMAWSTRFGGDLRRLSEMYACFMQWLDRLTFGLVHGPTLERWVPLFPYFNKVIKDKMAYRFGLEYAQDEFKVMSATDCNMRTTTTPGTGPAERGRNARRHQDHDHFQQATYTGYGKRHGLKSITLTFPNGIVGNVWGPVSIRENDTGVLNLSTLDRYLEEIQEPNNIQEYNNNRNNDRSLYKTLVDSTFPRRRALQKRIDRPLGEGAVLTDREKLCNRAHASARQMAELPYRLIMILFKISQSKMNNWRMLTSRHRSHNKVIGQQYRALFFFYNCYVCLNGNTVTSTFYCDPPSLEKYLEVIMQE